MAEVSAWLPIRGNTGRGLTVDGDTDVAPDGVPVEDAEAPAPVAVLGTSRTTTKGAPLFMFSSTSTQISKLAGGIGPSVCCGCGTLHI